MDRSRPVGRATTHLTAVPKNAVQDTPIIHTWHAARLIWQHRRDGGPLFIGEFVAHDSGLQIGGLNHDPAADLNNARRLNPLRLSGASGNLMLNQSIAG
jgi:hypothetical protein